MAKSCSICGLNKYSAGRTPITMHSVPKDEEIARKWREKFPILPRTGVVCSRHFLDVDVSNGRLRKSVVPLTTEELKAFKYRQIPQTIVTISKNYVPALPNNNVCRVCLCNGEKVVVPISVCIQNRTVADLINSLAGIEVLLNDNLPQFVCTECIKLLVTAYNIRELCIKSDMSLRWQYVSMNEVKKEPEDDPPSVIIEKKTEENESYMEPEVKADYSEMQDETMEMEDLDVYEDEVKHEPESPESEQEEDMEESEYEGYERLDFDHDYDIPGSSKRRLEQAKTEKASTYKRKTPKPVFMCYICRQEFDRRNKKNDHLNMEHADFDLNCKLCPKRFKTVIGMDYHLEVHEKPELLRHMCYICSQTFSRGWFLNVHLKYFHKVEAEYQCDLCGLQEVTKGRLKTHIESKHLKTPLQYLYPHIKRNKERRFACDECQGKQYTTKVALIMHKCVMHDMKTNVQCSECLQFFPLNSYLKAHQKGNRCSGDPEKKSRIINKVDVSIYREEVDSETYRCKICKKIFTGERRRDRISIHYSNMHKYVCEYCSSNFKNQAQLDQHIENSH